MGVLAISKDSPYRNILLGFVGLQARLQGSGLQGVQCIIFLEGGASLLIFLYLEREACAAIQHYYMLSVIQQESQSFPVFFVLVGTLRVAAFAVSTVDLCPPVPNVGKQQIILHTAWKVSPLLFLFFLLIATRGCFHATSQPNQQSEFTRY